MPSLCLAALKAVVTCVVADAIAEAAAEAAAVSMSGFLGLMVPSSSSELSESAKSSA